MRWCCSALPALYALARRGTLKVPVVGVATSRLSLAQLCKRASDAKRHLAGSMTSQPLVVCSSCLVASVTTTTSGYFHGAQKGAGRGQARVIVEKPIGRDLASTRALNRVLNSVFADDAIFRIDHYLGEEAIINILYSRFANTFMEPIWNRNYVASMQITLSEDFGVEGRGGFYESMGMLRDVVRNNLFQSSHCWLLTCVLHTSFIMDITAIVLGRGNCDTPPVNLIAIYEGDKP